MNFYLPLPTLSPIPVIRPPPAPVHTIPSAAILEIMVFDGDWSSRMWSIASLDLSSSILASFGGIFDHTREVIDTTIAPHILLGLPPFNPPSSTV